MYDKDFFNHSKFPEFVFKILFTLEYQVGMWFDCDIKCRNFISFPTPYTAIESSFSGNFLTRKNIIEFSCLFISYNFNADIFRQERLYYKSTIIIYI